MSNRSRWAGLIRSNLFQLFGIGSKKVRPSKSPKVTIESLEDRSVPAYVPLLGYGQADGYPLQNPGVITSSFAFGDLGVTGNFYESVDASAASGALLYGDGAGGKVYNTDGPVLTINGGDLKLGSGISFGKASSFTGTFTSGNTALVNGGGQLNAITGNALDTLTTEVQAGSQLLLGDTSVGSVKNLFTNPYILSGTGISGGAVQAVAGLNIGYGSITSTGSITVGAASGSTLILNGAVNGVRSNTAFSSFSTTGAGTVILDNVLPVATVSVVGSTTTNNPAVTYRVTLSEPAQIDLALGDLVVTGGTANSVSRIDALTYEYSVTSNVSSGSDGTTTAFLAAGSMLDKAFLTNLKSNVATVTLDRQPPTASGTFPNINATLASASQTSINVTYSDGAGVGIDQATINATNLIIETDAPGTLAVASNPSYNPATGVATYTILSGSTWGQLAASGKLNVTVKVNAGTVSDTLGNAILGSTLGSFVIDTVAPVLTVNGGLPISPTNSTSPITVPVTTSEPIGTFNPAAFTATNGTVTGVVLDSADPTNSTLLVSIAPTAGQVQAYVTLQIAQGAVSDSAGNQSNAFTPSPGFIYDTIKPIAGTYTFPLDNVNAANANNPLGIDFQLTDPKYGNVSGSGIDINSVTNSIVDVRDPNNNPVAVSGIYFDPSDGYGYIDVQPVGGWASAVQGQYTVTIKNYKDYAGNTGANFLLGTFFVAATAPTATLSASPTSNIPGISTVSLNFSTASSPTNSISVSDPNISSFVVTGGTASNLVKIGANQYTFDITPSTKNASVTVQLPARSVTDQAGNGNLVSNTLALAFNISTPIPSITLNSVTSPTNQTVITGTVRFTEAVTLNSGNLFLAQSDFNFSSGSISSFVGGNTTDGINYPFTITLNSVNQTLTGNVKAAIAKAVIAPNSNNLAGSATSVQVVVTAPTAAVVAPIAPINSTISSPTAVIPFQVKFTTGSGIAMDFSNAVNLVNAISITGPGGTLSVTLDPALSPNPATGVVSYLISDPGTADGWYDLTYQGTYSVDLVGGLISDVAGNAAAATNLTSFEVATALPGAYLYSLDAEPTQWINNQLLAGATTPGEITVYVYATAANGALINPTKLNTTIVPNATNFSASGFTIASVSSNWLADSAQGGAWYLLVNLVPATDVVGDTSSVGPASVAINPNAYYDIYGNGNASYDPLNLFNTVGFLSFVGIDRISPSYNTPGVLPTKLSGSQIADPVNISISYADATSGLNNSTITPNNLVVLLNGVPYSDVIITGQVNPVDTNTFDYTFTPTTTWVNGSYSIAFTSVLADSVYDSAQSIVFDNQSANGIAPGLVLSAGQPVQFAVDSIAPVVNTAIISGASPTNVQPLSASVTFSEAVQGFTAGNLSLSGATLGSGGITTLDSITYTFDLIPSNSIAQVSFTVIPAGVVDFFGNALVNGATSNQVDFTTVGPVGTLTQVPLSINASTGSGNTNSFKVQYTANVDYASISGNNYLIDNGATITGVSVEIATRIATYTISAPGASWNLNNGLYSIVPNTDTSKLPKDVLGNVANIPSTSFTVDTVVPTTTAVFDQPSPTNLTLLTVTVTFSKDVTFITPNSDFSNLFTVTNGSVASYTQLTPSTYSVGVNALALPEGERTVTLTVLAGAALDSADNPNIVSNVASIQFDNVGPLLAVSPQTLVNGETATKTITVNVTMSPDGAYQFQAQPEAGISVANANFVQGSFAPVSGFNGAYSFQITATNPGLVQVGFGLGAFVDSLGNPSKETIVSYNYVDTLTETITSPDVNQGGSTALSSLNFVTIFDRAIVSYNPNVAQFFTVSNATITNLVQDSVNPAKFTYKVLPTVSGTPVSVQVNAGVATDVLGLTNQASTPFTFNYTKPNVTATLSAGATDITSLNSVWVDITFSEPVTGFTSSNFASKFTIGGATINTSTFTEVVAGTTYKFVINPTAVAGSTAPVAVSLQLNANSVTPPNEASNLVSFTYVNNPVFVGKGASSVVTRINSDGSQILIQAYSPGYFGGVRVAGANFAGFTNSNSTDLLAVAGTNGQGHVTVFNGQTGTSTPSVSFFAFPGFMGGAYVAAGDVNADGFNDMVVSAGQGGGPNVKVYSGNPADAVNAQTPGLIFSFFAYSSGFTGGASVGVSDINGDGYADVVTGAGPGGGPHVKVFSGKELASQGISLLASFFSAPSTVTTGVYVSAGDLTGDGKPEIISALMSGSTPTVSVFTLAPSSGTYVASLLNSFDAYSSNFQGGVTVGTVNLETGSDLALVTGPGVGGGPNLKVWQLNAGNTFDLIDSVFIGDPLETDGLFVS